MPVRTPTEWKRHARLCGEISERVVQIISNSTKERILEAIEIIDKEAQREFYQKAKAAKGTESPTVPNRFSESDNWTPESYVGNPSGTKPTRSAWNEVE